MFADKSINSTEPKNPFVFFFEIIFYPGDDNKYQKQPFENDYI
jgi:hypothetical protein